jgi:uncharacterized protein (TIGR00369 family)
MHTLGAEIVSLEPGVVEIELPFSPSLTQQDGYIHAGVTISILDTACGYAAFTLMESSQRVLTVELKVNLLSPAVGTTLLARGEVIRPGRNLTVCSGEAFTLESGRSKHVASVLTTMTSVREHGR